MHCLQWNTSNYSTGESASMYYFCNMRFSVLTCMSLVFNSSVSVMFCFAIFQVRIQRGARGPEPPGKSQVIWVSVGNKPPPPPWKKLDPAPLENVGPPLEPWKMIDFFEIDHLTSVKKLRTKKNRCQIILSWTPPDENSWICACIFIGLLWFILISYALSTDYSGQIVPWELGVVLGEASLTLQFQIL